MPPPAHFIIHSLRHAMAAAQAGVEAGRTVTLHSPRNSAASLGAEGWLAILDAVRADLPPDNAALVVEGYLDCADAPGLALAALRIGLRRIRLERQVAAWDRVADIARQQGAELTPDRPADALDMASVRDPLAAARVWVKP